MLKSGSLVMLGMAFHNSVFLIVTKWLPQLQASCPHLRQERGRGVARCLKCLSLLSGTSRAYQGAPADFCLGLFDQNCILWLSPSTREPGEVNI